MHRFKVKKNGEHQKTCVYCLGNTSERWVNDTKQLNLSDARQTLIDAISHVDNAEVLGSCITYILKRTSQHIQSPILKNLLSNSHIPCISVQTPRNSLCQSLQ